MELVMPNNNLIRGKSYMAYVIVTPYFNPGGNTPVMLRFNELRRKEKPDIEGGQTLKSSIKQKQMM